MNPKLYDKLTNPSAAWICVQCAMPSFSSSLFESYFDLEDSNSFDALKNLNGKTPPTHGTPPSSPFKSYPKKLFTSFSLPVICKLTINGMED